MKGKLINGEIERIPASVKYTDPKTKKTKTYKPAENAPTEVLAALGYKDIIYTDAPEVENGFHLVGEWQETETEIVRVWKKVSDAEDKSVEGMKRTLQARLAETDSEALAVLENVINGATSTTKLTSQIKENTDAMRVFAERAEIRAEIASLEAESVSK